MDHLFRKTTSQNKGTLFHEFLNQIHETIRSERSGAVADYIPELLLVNEDDFGIAIATVDGYVYQVGDSMTPFSIQSVSKAFTYGIALQDKGEDQVIAKVDVEPSGEAFNSISLEPDSGRPRNPMINAGAIAVTGLVEGESSDDKINRILKEFGKYTGHEMEYDEKIYLSEKRTGHRNRAISHMLRNYEILEDDPEATLDAYFRQCSILVTCRDLAVMGACLANSGVNPITGIRTLEERYIPNVLSVMSSCGMYDYSGNWIYQVGMPAKSGVGGGIVAVLPGQFGLAVYSPRLDVKGNSVRGIQVCEQLSANLGLHMMHSSRVTTSTVIRSLYTGADIHSKRARDPDLMSILSEHGHKILIVELMAELTFVSSELIIRELSHRADRVDYLILDFSRVTSIDKSACKIFSEISQKYQQEMQTVLYVGTKNKYRFTGYIKQQQSSQADTGLLSHDDLDRALEWCEDQLLESIYPREVLMSSQVVPLHQQLICREMTDAEIAFLDSLLVQKSYARSEMICREGDPAELVYFVLTGRVSAEITVRGKVKTWLGGSAEGSVFGESALLGNEVRSADVVADTDVVLKELVAHDLLQSDHPVAAQVLQKFYRNLSVLYDTRIRRANAQIRALSR